jgi:hypothetical protein
LIFLLGPFCRITSLVWVLGAGSHAKCPFLREKHQKSEDKNNTQKTKKNKKKKKKVESQDQTTVLSPWQSFTGL